MEKPVSYTLTEVVTDEMTAKRIGSAGAKILSTPNMLALMEGAALTLAREYLDEGMTTVGVEAHVKHLASTPVGMKVKACAEITNVSENGKMVDFIVKAWDEKGLIGQGTHTRAIINNERFLNKCNAKLEG